MTDQVHWWLAALSFGFGLALTYALLAWPAQGQMPAWVTASPPAAKRNPPAMKATAAEAPTKRPPGSKPGPPKKKAVSDRPPTKRVTGDAVTERISVATDAATERIPLPKDAPTERIPVASDAATQRIPIAKKVVAKKTVAKKAVAKKMIGKKTAARKVPAKKIAARGGQPGLVRTARPKGPPTRRIPGAKDAATEKISASEEPTTLIPLIPYAPYGPGSMRANHDGSGPEGWLIKGRMDSRLSYGPDDPDYADIVAQVWFQDEDFAARAFFTPWRKSSQKA